MVFSSVCWALGATRRVLGATGLCVVSPWGGAEVPCRPCPFGRLVALTLGLTGPGIDGDFALGGW